MTTSNSSAIPTFTGTQVNYYAICQRKLWLFTRGVEMERENENVQIGKMVGEASYSRSQKEIAIDDRIVIDWIVSKVLPYGTLVIHETKKSRSFDDAHRLQVLYYLFYLKRKGVKARGEINYPLLKKTQTIELTPGAKNRNPTSARWCRANHQRTPGAAALSQPAFVRKVRLL